MDEALTSPNERNSSCRYSRASRTSNRTNRSGRARCPSPTVRSGRGESAVSSRLRTFSQIVSACAGAPGLPEIGGADARRARRRPRRAAARRMWSWCASSPTPQRRAEPPRPGHTGLGRLRTVAMACTLPGMVIEHDAGPVAESRKRLHRAEHVDQRRAQGRPGWQARRDRAVLVGQQDDAPVLQGVVRNDLAQAVPTRSLSSRSFAAPMTGARRGRRCRRTCRPSFRRGCSWRESRPCCPAPREKGPSLREQRSATTVRRHGFRR